MEDNKIKIGITQGDINGVGYEVILKTFADPVMLELCTPVIYGSPKVAAYHRKSLDLPTNFSIVNTAAEAAHNRLSVVNCTDDEVKVEFSKPDPEAGKAALGALEKAIEEFREGLIDVIVTAPINKHTIQSEGFAFPGHTEYIEQRLGNGSKSLMILMKEDFRVALVTGHIPVREIASSITKELIQEKLAIFNRSLKQDFGIGAPRIAVLALNPHAGDDGLLGTEEQEIISPAIQEDIDTFLKEKQYELKNEVAVKSDYYRNSNMEYSVRCQVIEQDTPLIDLTLSVPTQAEAETIANNWAKKNQEVYALIMSHLL